MLKRKQACALALAAFAAAGCGTGTRGSPEEDARMREIETRVGDFDPRYVQGGQGRHFAVFFRSAGDSMVLDAAAPQIRPGNLRYFPPANTGFRVSYRDANNRELGSYSVEDPRTVRVCDDGGPRGVVPARDARFEVLLPANPAIAVLELGDPERPMRVRVDTLLRRVAPPQRDNRQRPR